MKIGLFGQFGCGNSGNDGSLEAMVALLRTTGSELVCFCPNPSAVEARYGIAAVPNGSREVSSPAWIILDRLLLGLPRRIRSIIHPFREVRGLDMLIVPGTGFLDDYRESPFGWPFMIFRWCLAARLFGTKLAFVSIGAGPIRHPISRWYMKGAARLCNFRSYRDAKSKQYLASIGLSVETDPVFPDLAFRLAAPLQPVRPWPGRVTVGVGVMSYSGWCRNAANGRLVHERYMETLAAFIRWLTDQDYDVLLLTGDREDEPAVDEMLDRLREHGGPVPTSVSYRPTRTLQELMRQLALVDVLVGSRFHNIVCALKMGTPLVSLSYAAKNDVLLEIMGLEGFSQHIESFELDRLVAQFRDALDCRDDLSERIRSGVRVLKTQLAQQDALLLALVSSGTRSEPQGRTALSRRFAGAFRRAEMPGGARGRT